MYFDKDSVICTFEHPFFVNNVRVEAKDLQQGDSLFAYAAYKIALDSIYTFRTETATAVYNLEAAGNHNYYVSESGVLVHNCGNMFKTSNIKEFKKLVHKLSLYESRITLQEAKQLEIEAAKYGGKLRYDMNPVTGKQKIPHVQIEGLGQRIEGRKIWLDIK